MKKLILLFIALLPAGFCFAQHQEDMEHGLECTSIICGKKATSDGSVITSHTCDGTSHTWVDIVPAKDHKPGEMTAIRKNWRRTRFVTDTAEVKTIMYIPQVQHTYSYINTGYPSMNEKQVGIGETTFSGPDTLINRKSPLVIEELCRLALERCSTAREAVALMGEMAEEYGYGDGGECLTVTDPNEAWFFEITGNGKHNTGAIWVAQRVPDDEISISANITRIGKVDHNDPENFMMSKELESVCQAHGLWDGESEFIFWKAVECSYAKGKNFREREFRVFSLLAPSLGLKWEDDEIPFSIKPDSLVSVQKVMNLLRDTYEGTQFDMCRNWTINVAEKNGVPAHKEISPIANPWLTTTARNTLNTIAPGTIEFSRTLAVAWCSYSTVIQSRNWLPDGVGGVVWYAVDNPAQSPRIPIFCGGSNLPKAFWNCGQKQYVPDCVLWQFRRANKLATLSWQTTKKEFTDILLYQEFLTFEELPNIEAAYIQAKEKKKAEILNNYTEKVYKRYAQKWDELENKYWLQFGRGF